MGKMGQPIYQINQTTGINILKLALLSTDIIVDALYGTGFHGEVEEKVAKVIELVNVSNRPIISVDIPSGVLADSGKVLGACIRANHTVTFGLPKLGLVMEPGASFAGEIHVVDISLPGKLTDLSGSGKQLLTLETISAWFSPRSPEGHKGSYGRVLILAGSRGMVGAARLTAKGALRAGAGLVTLAVPESVQPVAAASLDEAMTKGLPETGEGTFSEDALDMLLEYCKQADVLALGPGITTHPETVKLIRTLLPKLTIPTVIDADGLNALSESTDILGNTTVPLVITPHPGEMSRLLNISVHEIQDDRLNYATVAAIEWNLTVLLKGAGTIVASPGGNVYINPTGNPGMATGGSGDVLTGIIAGLLGQGLRRSMLQQPVLICMVGREI
ncbi:hypothetical protein N752_20905 [Desulforamulus aquiferis]|nr:hypothetical protein N752_20905 [Desulforamulus aquiferis]